MHAMLSGPTIQIDHLTKSYGSHRGIIDVSLSATSGQIVGFLGPNGAGKTTAIRVLMGFLYPTSGSASILGRDVVRESVTVRRSVGYLPGDAALYGNRTGGDLMALSLHARGLHSSARGLQMAERLQAPMDRLIKKCSRGMRQKIALVLTLAHDPQVLILDEPTSGLDPLAQRELLRLLDEEAKSGKTVLFSSHVLSEAEQVCDRVAILREGRLIVEDSVENLRGRKYKEVTVTYSGAAPNLEGVGDVEVVWQHQNRLTLRVRSDVRALLRRLSESAIDDVTISEPSLEEVFLDYYRESRQQ
jgi:ABC-2 type transport system ATP-binding protein